MRYSSRRKLFSFECLTESKWKRANSYTVSQFSILCSSCDRHDDSASGCLLHSRARDKCVELNDEGKLRWGECADLLKDKKGLVGKEERVSLDRPQSDFTPSFTELIESILYVPGFSPQASNMGYRPMSEVSTSFVPFPDHHWIAHCLLSFTFVNMEHFFRGCSLPRNTRKHRQTLSVAVSRFYILTISPLPLVFTYETTRNNLFVVFETLS